MAAGNRMARKGKADWIGLAVVGTILSALAVGVISGLSEKKALGSPIEIADLANKEPRHFRQTPVVSCYEPEMTNYVVLQEIRLEPRWVEWASVNPPKWVYIGNAEFPTNKHVSIWRDEIGTVRIHPFTGDNLNSLK
jgi:hypothetical protein